jgi:hypothetical protein
MENVMKELISLSTKKLELLNNNGDGRKILELDIAFNKAYKGFLDRNNVNSLDALDHSKYIDELRQLKTIVTKIYTIEKKNAKVQQKKNMNIKNKKITNLYKKNMK